MNKVLDVGNLDVEIEGKVLDVDDEVLDVDIEDEILHVGDEVLDSVNEVIGVGADNVSRSIVPLSENRVSFASWTVLQPSTSYSTLPPRRPVPNTVCCPSCVSSVRYGFMPAIAQLR